MTDVLGILAVGASIGGAIGTLTGDIATTSFAQASLFVIVALLIARDSGMIEF